MPCLSCWTTNLQSSFANSPKNPGNSRVHRISGRTLIRAGVKQGVAIAPPKPPTPTRAVMLEARYEFACAAAWELNVRLPGHFLSRPQQGNLACGDGLVLEGHTHTYYAKQLAQHAVMEAVDLPIHANEIVVV